MPPGARPAPCATGSGCFAEWPPTASIQPITRSTILSREAARLAAATGVPTGPEIARFDVTMSWAMLREFRQVHVGRVRPADVGFDMPARTDVPDSPSLLADAVAESRLVATARGLAPDLPEYRWLRERLARYRAIAANRALRPISPLVTSVHPGETYADLPMLRLWLRALGDLPDTSSRTSDTDDATYVGDVVDAVRHLQERYGLAPDGILGRATAAALRVPVADRVNQIALAMERLRWLPDLGRGRYILVNIPMFRLWAWDAASATGHPALSMAVIVGRALRTETPVVGGELRSLTFRPDWTVPVSIVRNEIIPAIDKDPAYLAKHAMEIVGGPIASPVGPLAPDVRTRLRRGTLSVRQRPGPTNALGLVKFVFPNDEDVYMHDTPSPELFARSRRDFSHGCVRLENPVGLATWALRGQDGWSRDRILAAMHAEVTSRVDIDSTDPGSALLQHRGRDARRWHAPLRGRHLRTRRRPQACTRAVILRSHPAASGPQPHLVSAAGTTRGPSGPA